jgi:hypothetical protein
MITYTPLISLYLVQANPRGLGATVAGEGVNLTPYLGDNSLVTCTKSTRLESGSFTIRFADQPHSPELLETLYAFIAPMDLIEIRMTHIPPEEAGFAVGAVGAPDPVVAYVIPIIMRGLVTSITRQETMGANGPQRWVNVIGHDPMKILQVIRINYYPGTPWAYLYNMGDWALFRTYAPDMTLKNMPALEFLDVCLEAIINPFIEGLATITAGGLANLAFMPWTGDFTIEGTVSGHYVATFNDNTLYELLKNVCDVGPFNEMYVEDTEEGTVFIVRPVPFKDVDGGFIQGGAAELDIPSVDIINQTISRTDETVANYFHVLGARISPFLERDVVAQLGGAGADTAGFYRPDYINCLEDQFGTKKLETAANLGAPETNDADANYYANHEEQGDTMIDWMTERRTLLADLNQDNSVFEEGTLRLRGNSDIHCGMYLNIHRGPNQILDMSCYAHTITHEWSYGNGFFTTVHFDRGTNYLDRIEAEGTYIQEIEAHATE